LNIYQSISCNENELILISYVNVKTKQLTIEYVKLILIKISGLNCI